MADPATKPRPARLILIRVPPRDRRTAALLLVAIAAALSLVALVNPGAQSILPACPTWRYLGVHCPGCGSTRATHWLLNGSLSTAWRFNPLLVAVGVPLGLWFIGVQASAAFLGVRPALRVPAWVGYAAAILLVGYMVLRNLPSPSLEWMRPPETIQGRADESQPASSVWRQCSVDEARRCPPDGLAAASAPSDASRSRSRFAGIGRP